MKINQPKKLYKNSECDICDCYLCDVFLVKHPVTNEDVIICRKCYKELSNENKIISKK